MVHILAPVVVMLPSVLVFVVLPKYHLLASGRVLGHVNVGVAKVVVVASGGLVTLRVVHRAVVFFDHVPRGAWSMWDLALIVGAMHVLLLSQLTRESVVVRKS